MGNHFDLAEGIAYGPKERERLDVYTPRGLDNPAPVVVFLYGGRWQSGSRDMYRLLGDALTRRGVVTVVPDYTLFPEAIFPTWVDQAAAAIAWTEAHVAEYGGDPSRLFVIGHSAGAHTATLLALDHSYLERAGLTEGAIRGFVSISGPISTTWTDPDVQELMGPEAGWAETYPVNFAESAAEPILFLHGGGDETVSPRNSNEMARLIEENGGCARAIVYPGIGHVEIIVALFAPWLDRAPIRDDILEFVIDPPGFIGCR